MLFSISLSLKKVIARLLFITITHRVRKPSVKRYFFVLQVHYTVLRTSEAQITYVFLYSLLTFCGVQSLGCLMSSFWEEQKLIVVHVRMKFFFRDPLDTYEENSREQTKLSVILSGTKAEQCVGQRVSRYGYTEVSSFLYPFV